VRSSNARNWASSDTNVGVLIAAAGAYALESRWPDILIGSIIAALFLGSAFGVLRSSVRVLQSRKLHITVSPSR